MKTKPIYSRIDVVALASLKGYYESIEGHGFSSQSKIVAHIVREQYKILKAAGHLGQVVLNEVQAEQVLRGIRPLPNSQQPSDLDSLVASLVENLDH